MKPVLARVILIKKNHNNSKTLSTEGTLHGNTVSSGEPHRTRQIYCWKRKGDSKWERKQRRGSEAAERRSRKKKIELIHVGLQRMAQSREELKSPLR